MLGCLSVSYNKKPRAVQVQGWYLVSSEAQAVRVLAPVALSLAFDFVPLWCKVVALGITSSHSCFIPNGNFSPNSFIVSDGWGFFVCLFLFHLVWFHFVFDQKKRVVAAL